MSEKEKFKILKVTMTQDYVIPMIDEELTKINGWTIKEVVKDWFLHNDPNFSHATRDGHRIGNSRKVIDVSFIEPDGMRLLDEATKEWEDRVKDA